MSEHCPICNMAESSPVHQVDDFVIVRCAACGLRYVDPLPPDEVLQAHYEDPGYFVGKGDQGYGCYADMHKALLPHFRRRLRAINRRLPAGGSLLDFGCAAGFFLELAQAAGWRVAGVELAPDMAQLACRKLGVRIVPDLEDLGGDVFDVVTMWEVIEHLPHPLTTLREVLARLRPGGLLMLSTPNTGHWQAESEPESWPGYRPPSHLVYFTIHTLRQALSAAGFVDIVVKPGGPLPPLPGWLRRVVAPLQRGLTTGDARAWRVSLVLWRAIRVGAWAWQRAFRPELDVFATLESTALRPL
jgi:SAM-dependent methyltransferase